MEIESQQATMGFMDVIKNFFMQESTQLVILVLLISVLLIYGIRLIINELRERKLHSLLHNKLDIEAYLKEIAFLTEKVKSKNYQARLHIYKAIGLYYKGETIGALEWLKEIKSKIDILKNTKDLNRLYTITLFYIMLSLDYTDKLDQVLNEKLGMIEKLKDSENYGVDARYILELKKFKNGNLDEAKKGFLELRKLKLTKLQKVMVSYQLALIDEKLDMLSECEKEIEEVMNSKKKSKNLLFVYRKLEELIKQKRSNSNAISSVDKDLEEEQRLAALEKINKQVEDEIKKQIEEEANKLKQKIMSEMNEQSKIDTSESK